MTALDVEKLVASNQGPSKSQCGVCRWIERRPAEEQAEWDKVCADKARWQHAAIHRAILSLQTDACDVPAPGRGSLENHRAQLHRRPR